MIIVTIIIITIIITTVVLITNTIIINSLQPINQLPNKKYFTFCTLFTSFMKMVLFLWFSGFVAALPMSPPVSARAQVVGAQVARAMGK